MGWAMEHVWAVIGWLYIPTTALIGLTIVLEKRHPTRTIAWLLVLAFVPVVGFLLYLLFGRHMRKRRAIRSKDDLDFSALKEKSEKSPGSWDHPLVRRLARIGVNAAGAPVTTNNRVCFFTDGETLFRAMLEDLRSARHHIHLAYYIVRHDGLGTAIQEILLERARSGVEVRFLFDHVGSVWLSRLYRRTLQAGGVELAVFLPVTFPLISRRLNFRYHRKITVVDGRIGYLGGFNIGDEYLGKHPRMGFWRDTHLRVEGEAVHSLQALFQADWAFASGRTFDGEAYFPAISAPVGTTAMQLIASGPDSPFPSIEHATLAMIGAAGRRLWIATPYLVPDEAVLMALKSAAIAGVDVRILLPSFPDHRLVFYASMSYVAELLAAGVRIYRYRKGFLHAKVVLADDVVASVGTANLDSRSFELNFEANFYLYDREAAAAIARQFEADFAESEEVDLYRFHARPLREHVVESFARLFSPLM
ncbi:MAG: cardiolipin synthase [Hydrogenibacillus schlegelii]|uniref:Cardiolipin synthase n=1 Tax=Hydrogenibacillus schlegelii TaxID=1484 RepID=A0A947CVR1_HYDSH|nr:cardiolipin synthase [Hydrogenibacillus schlegelii]